MKGCAASDCKMREKIRGRGDTSSRSSARGGLIGPEQYPLTLVAHEDSVGRDAFDHELGVDPLAFDVSLVVDEDSTLCGDLGIDVNLEVQIRKHLLRNRWFLRRRRCCLVSLQGLDRKSTRLNSSHHSISYAVFCLKKK